MAQPDDSDAASAAKAQNDIASVVATLAARQGENAGRRLTGPERAAVLLLALGEQHGAKIWNMLDDDELRSLSIVMSTLGTDRGADGREPAARVRLPHVGGRRADGQLRRHRAAAAAVPAAGAGRHHHGGDPRPGRTQHVGEALQRAGGRARQLSEERIPADHRRGAVEDQARARRARARHPAGGPRARRGEPHAAHGGGAEGGHRAGREHAAHRVHVQPLADAPPRRARGDGRDLQQFRSPDRDPLHDRAGGAEPRQRRAHQDADVHLRRSDAARCRLGADADAPDRQGQAGDGAQGCHRARCGSSSWATCRAAPPRCSTTTWGRSGRSG